MVIFRILIIFVLTLSVSFSSNPLCVTQIARASVKLGELKDATDSLIEKMETLDEKLNKETKLVDALIEQTLMEGAELSRTKFQLEKMLSAAKTTVDITKLITRERLIYLKGVTSLFQYYISKDEDESLKGFYEK